MPPIRFIHAADLHLDAAFSGLSRDIPAEFAERLRTATFTAFRRLLDLCERESPDFLLLAGDVYNQEDASVSAQLALRDGFRRLESLSIPVFLVHGNHDPLASRLRSVRWPGNVTVFGELPDAVPVFRKGEGTPLAIIHGASHASGRETRNLAALFRRTEACGLHVGLLHATPGDADGVARYAPFSQGDLKASGMDYWALGHIHDRREVCREPLAAYPGCTQGLHINEPGEKGCLLVTAEARPDGGYAVRTSFRPLGPAVWKTLDMDLGGAASLDELENRLRTGLDRAAAEVWSGCEMLLVRLRLQGRTELDGLLRKGTTCAELADRLREDGSGVPRIWIKDIDVATRPCVERGALLEREDLLGEVFRLSDAVLQGNYDGAARILGDLLKMQTEPIMILAALGSQLRRIYTARMAIDSGKDKYWLMELWEMKSDYPAKLLLSAAKKTTAAWCADAVQMCQVLDRRMKSEKGVDAVGELKLLLVRLGAQRR